MQRASRWRRRRPGAGAAGPRHPRLGAPGAGAGPAARRRRSAARRPSWAGWPASRRPRCARWSAPARPQAGAGMVDLRALLTRATPRPRVTVVAPATAVWLPAPVGDARWPRPSARRWTTSRAHCGPGRAGLDLRRGRGRRDHRDRPRRRAGHPRRPARGGRGGRPARRRPVDPGPDRRPGRHGRRHLRARPGHRGRDCAVPGRASRTSAPWSGRRVAGDGGGRPSDVAGRRGPGPGRGRVRGGRRRRARARRRSGWPPRSGPTWSCWTCSCRTCGGAR